jgi:hypothetical protein
LPELIAAIDDKKKVVTITFFDSVDPDLFKDLTSTNPKALGWSRMQRRLDPGAMWHATGRVSIGKACALFSCRLASHRAPEGG